MQPAKPAYPAYPSLQPSYGMGAQQQPEQDGCLRTSVFVTGIIHIVISIFPTNVFGIIAGCFQLTGAGKVRTTSKLSSLFNVYLSSLYCRDRPKTAAAAWDKRVTS